MAPANLHATAIALGDRGVLITGESGSGKTSLAFSLIDRWRAGGRSASLIADDQVLLSSVGGRLVCRVPTAIAGLAEVRGLGPVALDHQPALVADLVVRLVPPREAPRLGEPESTVLGGIPIPFVDLAARDARAAVLAVAAWFRMPPFL